MTTCRYRLAVFLTFSFALSSCVVIRHSYPSRWDGWVPVIESAHNACPDLTGIYAK